MDKFLDPHNQPKLNQEDIKHLNSPTMSNGTEAVIESHYKEEPRTWWIHAEFYQTFKKELISILLKLFQGLEKGVILPNSF
jgi:hypothetical protein